VTIYLVGGAPSEGIERLWDSFVDAARTRGNRFSVALLSDGSNATDYLESYFEPIIRRFPEAQIDPIWLLKEESEEENAAAAREDEARPAGIIVGDGNVLATLEAMERTRGQLGSFVRTGVPYLGFGAGAAICAKHAIVGGYNYRGAQICPEAAGEGIEDLDIRPGLALVGPAIDIRLDSDSTLARAIAATAAGPMVSALALTSNGCLAIDTVSGRTQPLGPGRIAWLSRHGEQTIVRFESVSALAK
jgi:cyanophycinase